MKNFETKSFELDVNVKSAVPIYEQIKSAVKLAILSEKLEDGDKLVSIRSLSTRFNINPLTIMKAYNQLESEGFLQSRRGAGYYVKTSGRGLGDDRRDMFQKSIGEFLEKVAVMGFTVNDLIEELKKYSEVKEDDQH